MVHQYVGDAVSQVTRKRTVTSHHFVENAEKRDTFQPCVLLIRNQLSLHHTNIRLTSSPTQKTDAYTVEETTHQPVVQQGTSLKPHLVHLAMCHQNEVQEVARLHKGVRHRHYLLIMSHRDR